MSESRSGSNNQGGSSGPLQPDSNRDLLTTPGSLQEASDALQTAFERIRQVRRSILQLSQSLPSTLDLEGEPQSRSTESDRAQPGIGPQHDALLLSGGAVEPADRGSESAFSRLAREYEVMLQRRGDTATPASTAVAPVVNLPPTSLDVGRGESIAAQPTSWTSTPSNVVPPRFTRPPRGPQPSSQASESAATTRGLRVAARERDPNAPRASLPSRETLANYVSILNDYQRILDHHQTALGGAIDNFPSSSTPGSTTSVPTPSSTAPAPNTAASTLQARYPRAHNLIYSAQLPIVSPNSPNRMEVLPRPVIIPRQSDGRSLPVLDLRASALERETGPANPASRAQADPQRRAMQRSATAGDSPSSANPAGEQLISWLFPSQDHPPSLVPRRDPQNTEPIRITRPVDLNSTRQRSAPPARRVWDRHDADGNEIPWEGDEAVERIRIEYRLQARADRARQDPLLDGVRNGRTIHGNVADSLLSVPSAPHRIRNPSAAEAPLYIDPLPMPLSEMGTKEDFQDETYPDVIIPTNACWAGR